MATTARGSNLKKPWAWLAALAALCLVLASSTALYVLNPSVKLTLPWWTAVAAPAAIYALVLPLCVPGLRVGGWLAGFGVLGLLHLVLGGLAAWLSPAVPFLPVRQFVASAFWSFPPALVLDMVGSLVMTLPFLDTLSPRPRAGAKRSARPAAAKTATAEGKSRESWARGGAAVEPAADARALATGSAGISAAAAGAAVGTVMAGATVGETLSAASISPTVEPESPPALPEIVAPSPPLTRSLEEPVVPVPILSSTNGTQAETIEDVPAPPESAEPAAAPLPDFRQAL